LENVRGKYPWGEDTVGKSEEMLREIPAGEDGMGIVGDCLWKIPVGIIEKTYQVYFLTSLFEVVTS